MGLFLYCGLESERPGKETLPVITGLVGQASVQRRDFGRISPGNFKEYVYLKSAAEHFAGNLIQIDRIMLKGSKLILYDFKMFVVFKSNGRRDHVFLGPGHCLYVIGFVDLKRDTGNPAITLSDYPDRGFIYGYEMLLMFRRG